MEELDGRGVSRASKLYVLERKLRVEDLKRPPTLCLPRGPGTKQHMFIYLALQSSGHIAQQPTVTSAKREQRPADASFLEVPIPSRCG